MALIARLREFYRQQDEIERRIDEWDEQQAGTAATPNTWYIQQRQRQRERRESELKQAYNSDFKTEAILLRDTIIPRLPQIPNVMVGPGMDLRIDVSMYGDLICLAQIETLASNLERLALQRPV